MLNLSESNGWKALENIAKEAINSSHAYLPSKVPMTIAMDNIHFDFSNQIIDEKIIEQLLNLAYDIYLPEKIESLLLGEEVNPSEKRPALHTALRAPDTETLLVEGKNIIEDIRKTRRRMTEMSEKIRAQEWLGHTKKPILNVVNLGVGGSDLGPKFCLNALKAYTQPHLKYYFISDADPDAFRDTTEFLNPEETLFIVSSKSFKTEETLFNAKKAIEWLGGHIENHFIAVTANQDAASEFGIKHILPIWDWVGGRFSSCSAINLITAIAIGPDYFDQFLDGAYLMDMHFKNTELKRNMPVMMGLIGVWNNNFLNINHSLILTYSKRLEHLVPFVQQLEMESNGKSVNIYEQRVKHATAPIIWGGQGNQAQHSYYQLLCQGTHKIALDFITLASNKGTLIDEMFERKRHVLTEGIQNQKNPHLSITGKIPSSHLCLKDCSPISIGKLISLYEHKTYVQGTLWGINPFDQPGVEMAKNR